MALSSVEHQVSVQRQLCSATTPQHYTQACPAGKRAIGWFPCKQLGNRNPSSQNHHFSWCSWKFKLCRRLRSLRSLLSTFSDHSPALLRTITRPWIKACPAVLVTALILPSQVETFLHDSSWLSIDSMPEITVQSIGSHPTPERAKFSDLW